MHQVNEDVRRMHEDMARAVEALKEERLQRLKQLKQDKAAVRAGTEAWRRRLLEFGKTLGTLEPIREEATRPEPQAQSGATCLSWC